MAKETEPKRDAEHLARRMGMTFSEYQSLMDASSQKPQERRLGMPLADFWRLVLRSGGAKTPENRKNGGETKHYAFFSNTACEYFPCHPGADPKNFNCLFCYCPLYMLGADCGGAFRYLPNGYKDCTACLYPHEAEHYDAITARYAEILTRMAQTEDT